MAIPSAQLRIGNWLQRLDDSFFQVTSGDIASIEIIPEWLHPKPIPLTPEILEKCGFVFEDNKSTRYGWYKRLNKDFWIVWYKTEVIGIEDNDSDVLIEVPCSYVHQLQNLTYALTGEELEFKP